MSIYPLENLDPNRFQQLCQSLLSKSFPDVQCFPILQADGGRDAILKSDGEQGKEAIVYQIKFTKNALKDSAPHKTVVSELKSELPRIASQIEEVATKYILITNIPGTGPRNSGSIDVVQRLLDEHFDMPAQCWWRDDIERRLDDAWDIKWSYPEIFRTKDILRIIIERGLNEDAERRTLAIQSFLREQFDSDTDVRFKQIDLQTKLLDLFIDVPINNPKNLESVNSSLSDYTPLFSIIRKYNSLPSQSEAPIGAATLLLHPIAQKELTRVVLEGAPGQGKSTIVQYICQVHRYRLLNKEQVESQINEEHRNTPVRLPFKVDCRDFAVWLSGKNPFILEAHNLIQEVRYRTLESFLAAQVEYKSGGSQFDVSDFQAVLKISEILIVFDGLDEVANIIERRNVVDEITKGIRRIQELSVSMQTIVTSRPSVFANSPGFPRNTFLYLQLGPIDGSLIKKYAKKWARARQLKQREEKEVQIILEQKLDQPHLRELARNPMQLTILLSLIHTKGTSLPDKRTALYDSYINLFFDREAEKSEVVREHRELLVDIHRYLAWVLHSEAQTKQTGGKVESGRLKNLVVNFLEVSGHDVRLAEQLFSGMVERVVALVSRIEGTYEFEVQPMREYFVARYLYDTAPYSPPDEVKPGTLPERFDALARDLFWQNVTRFYAGCYSQGELPSLLVSLEALSKSQRYKSSCYPQSLAVTLLSDYTFGQYPITRQSVVTFVLDHEKFRLMVASGQPGPSSLLYLPEKNGNSELISKCFEELSNNPKNDYAWMLVELINMNSEIMELSPLWRSMCEELNGKKLTQWISYGLRLGVVQNIENSEIDRLIDDPIEYKDRLNLLAFRGQWNYVIEKEQRVTTVVDMLLDRDNGIRGYRSTKIIHAFAEALSHYKYMVAHHERSPQNLAIILDRYGFDAPKIDDDEQNTHQYEILEKCRSFTLKSHELLNGVSGKAWATTLNPWTNLSETGRELFGERWALCILANVAAGIRSKEEKCHDAAALFNHDVPITHRARHARLKAGYWRWWEKNLTAATNQMDIAFVLLLLFSWAGPTVILRLRSEIDQKLKALNDNWWMKLHTVLNNQNIGFDVYPTLNLDSSKFSDTTSERMVVALSPRLSDELRLLLYDKFLSNYEGSDIAILELRMRVAFTAVGRGNMEEWRKWLPKISDCYNKGVVSSFIQQPWMFISGRFRLPLEVAEAIIKENNMFPMMLVRYAEEVYRNSISDKVIPVGRVAEEKKWFNDAALETVTKTV